MEENFKIEIISPEKIIFSNNIKIVTLPSYEGDMSILKDHISIITFLRPGIVKLEKSDGNFEDFFVQDGIVEFYNNTLILLSTSAKNIKDLSKEFIALLDKDTQNKLSDKNISDHDRYILNHQLETIKEIRI
jgi:F-type H+-transporting ATPase subunit epsilon